MKHAAATLILLMGALPTLAAGASSKSPDDMNGRIVSDAPWPSLPPWEELDDFTHGYFTPAVYEHARTQTDLEIRDIRYLSDGLTIRGMLIRPRHPGATKWPAIIFNRGGTGDYGRIGNYGVPCKQ